MAILLTGGAGFIGSHIFYALKDREQRNKTDHKISRSQKYDDEVVILDNLSTGDRSLLPEDCPFYQGDAGNEPLVLEIMARHHIDTVIHAAGSIIVSESVENPQKYYQNNMTVSLSLLKACVAHGVKRFIFSSTASVYGDSDKGVVVETDPLAPMSPYASSKMFVERMIQDFHHAYGMDYVILRYFNVAGADPKGRTGQVSQNATHLIKVLCEVVTGKRDKIFVFGDDYPTKDGSCVRDFIHVSDLADAHVDCVSYLKEKEIRGDKTGEILNCGYGQGYSVLEVIERASQVSGRNIAYEKAERRPGDIALLMANSERLKEKTGWNPRYQSLDQILQDAFRWELQKKNKK